MTEEWRGVPEWESLYQVSNHGRVRSLDRMGKYKNTEFNRIFRGRLLKPNIVQGYAQVTLTLDGNPYYYKVHRLVLLAFVGERPAYPRHACNHIDGNKLNNRLDNLEWVTYQANMDHAVETGLLDIKGEKNPSSVLTNAQVDEIRSHLSQRSLSYDQIAGLYGVSKAVIACINQGRSWIDASIDYPIRRIPLPSHRTK